MAPTVVSIEGNLGSGKSTLLRLLQERFAGAGRAVVFIGEDVANWEKLGFLKGVYSGSLNSCAFQLAVLQSLSARLLAAARDDGCLLIVTERSAGSNARVFAQANLQGAEMDLYQYSYEKTRESAPPALSHEYIYLQAPVDVLQTRIKDRARDAESGIPPAYVELLNALHEQWLASESSVVAVDAARSPDETADVVESLLADRLQKAVNEWVSQRGAHSSLARAEKEWHQVSTMHAAVDFLLQRSAKR